MDAQFARKVTRNTLFALLTRAWSLAVGLLLTPYILRRLGTDEYGIWVLIGAVTGYLGLLDLGFGTAFVKHISEFDARRDPSGVSGVMSAGLLVYFVIGSLIAATAYLTMGAVVDLLGVPEGMTERARFAFGVAIVALLVGNFGGVYQSVVNGLQRMDVSNTILICNSVIYVAGCIAFLHAGLGIRGLAVNQAITETLGAAAAAYWAYRLYPSLKFDARQIRAHFVGLLRYGLNLQISRIAVLVNFQFDKLAISRFIGPSNVTVYDLGSRLGATLRSVPVLLLSALTPAIAELQVLKGRAEVYEMFLRASKYVGLVAFAIFTAAAFSAPAFVVAWVGPGYDSSVVIMRILCVGYLLNTLAGPVSPLVQGLGRPEYQRNTEVLSLVLNVVLSLSLIRRYGIYGAAAGTSIAMSVGGAYYLWRFHRFMERPLLPFMRTVFLKPAVCALASGLVTHALVSVLTGYVRSGRTGALVVFAASVCACISCFGVLVLASRYFDDRDLALIGRYLPLRISRLRRTDFWK